MSRIHTAPASDLLRGHTLLDGRWTCLFCEASFEEGLVFPDPDPDPPTLRTAEKASQHHVDHVHGGPLAALMALGRTGHGLSEVQARVLELSAQGLDDSEMATELGGRSVSTVRNHRFQLRKKHREARIFSAIMDMLEARPAPAARFVEFHAELPTTDDRTAITNAEAAKLRAKYFDADNPTELVRIPKKEKHKLVVLQAIVEHFERGRCYAEKDVNCVLKPVNADTAALRRYLVDYRFMSRTADGSAYWRSDGDTVDHHA